VKYEDVEVAAEAAPFFQSFKLGNLELGHRIVYAPLTRCRAVGTVPQENMVLYYGQRASPGLLMVTEATVVAPEGHGYPNTPGIYTDEQVAAWKPIVEAVHAKKAFIFSQLWHVGRASHATYQPDGGIPVSCSAIAIKGDCFTNEFKMEPYPVPRALTVEEIKTMVVDRFAQGAKNAMAAGFDGVEIHSANGYILHQFICDTINQRTDAYGGSIENRCRLTLEVVDAVVAAVGDAKKVGIRLSPFLSTFLDGKETQPMEVFAYLVKELNERGLAYLHMVEGRSDGNAENEACQYSLDPFRSLASKTAFILAGGYDRDSGAAALKAGRGDLVCYGRHFLANPDMPKRFALGAPLNAYNRDHFYSGHPTEGYTDYPFLE